MLESWEVDSIFLHNSAKTSKEKEIYIQFKRFKPEESFLKQSKRAINSFKICYHITCSLVEKGIYQKFPSAFSHSLASAKTHQIHTLDR